jgi:2'-5' RNA ligase
VRAEWELLHGLGLPSEQRPQADPSHRPHITLYAGDVISPAAEPALGRAIADLHLTLELGALMLFGPHRERYVLVHAVVPSAALLYVQGRVAEACAASPASYFAPGRWSPHVTVARRVRAGDVPGMLAALAYSSAVGRSAVVTRCRRWDSLARRTWLL